MEIKSHLFDMQFFNIIICLEQFWSVKMSVMSDYIDLLQVWKVLRIGWPLFRPTVATIARLPTLADFFRAMPFIALTKDVAKNKQTNKQIGKYVTMHEKTR